MVTLDLIKSTLLASCIYATSVYNNGIITFYKPYTPKTVMMFCSGSEVNATLKAGCLEKEKNALLKLKVSFSDPSNRLSSWDSNTDCCKWQGVNCDKLTGHVIALDLQNKYNRDDYFYFYPNMLSAEKTDSSILELKHLSYLDLSGNDFQQSPIPSFLGFLNQLHHLNLSNANFTGAVPHHLGNLSHLNALDLNDEGYYQLVVDDFTWVSGLSLLGHLDMSGVNLNGTKGLLKVLNMLPYIEVLRLSDSNLENRNLGHAVVNTSLTNIQQLDLSFNILDGELPHFLQNMTSLRDLDLSENNYNSCSQVDLYRLTNLVRLNLRSNSLDCNVDSIPLLGNKCHMESFQVDSNFFWGEIANLFLLNLSSCPDHRLATLNLWANSFYGNLPEQICTFRKLKLLDLRENNITGPIPTSIGNLSALIELYLSDNRLSGSIPPTIGNLRALDYLSFSGNQLSGIIPSSIGNLSALGTLDLDSNQISGLIPSSTGNLTALAYLFLSSNQINGNIPTWLWQLSNLKELHISNNNIDGPIPDSLCKGTFLPLSQIDISRNRLSGILPDCWWKLGKNVYLSHNKLSGGIRNSVGESCPLISLFLSNNSFTGKLPSTLRNCDRLRALDVSRNHLRGNLPQFWTPQLQYLALSSNELSGDIPDSLGGADSLVWLQLSNNAFTGEVPSTLRDCTQLIVLDVGHNNISGELPKWTNYLIDLRVLRLTTNVFSGTIPSDFCQLSSLQILDLSNNHLIGNVPRCFVNFSAMAVYNDEPSWNPAGDSGLQQVIKGMVMEYYNTLRFVVNMDLSNNFLSGDIPPEITNLAALIGLNFSYNKFQGKIPRRIGDMKRLESLDLSNNNLIGDIPLTLSDLTSLSKLNLSHNNLTGQIPTGSQLQTLIDPSIYEGNPGLCGDPLPKKCHEDKASNSPNAESHDKAGDEEGNADTIWFVGVVISGFASGFWGAVGVLMFKRSWRSVFFGYVDEKIAKLLGRR